MKFSHHLALAGALFVGASLVAAPARAADPDISIPKVVLPNPNGFDLIVQAATAYVPGIEGAPMTKQAMTANENLMAQRQSVGRNAKSLALLHQALLLPVMTPTPSDAKHQINYDSFRTLGRLLKQEASVKTTTADWLGSLNCQLDVVELGVLMTRGAGLEAVQVGLSLEALGHLGMNSVIPRLSPAECGQVAARLQKIESERPTLAEILRGEKSRALVFTQYSMETRDWERVLNGQPDEDPAADPAAAPEGGVVGNDDGAQPGGMAAAPPPPPEGPFNPQEINQLRNMGLIELQTNLARTFDALANNAQIPYGSTLSRVAPAADPWSRLLTKGISEPSIRMAYATARTQNLLLASALGLTATRTLTGKYPATLAAPLDPFRPTQSFIYKPAGEAYLLYSVGPDGKDDGGTAAKIARFKRDDEAVAVSGGLDLKATGDIVAPVF